MSSVPEMVTLKGGMALPANVVLLALKLEAAGCTLTMDGDDLVIRPGRLVTPDDRQRVHAWRDDLKRLVRHCDEVCA